MNVTKLVNKKLMIFCKKYKHMEMRYAYPIWAKNVFMFNEKRHLTPAQRNRGVKKFH